MSKWFNFLKNSIWLQNLAVNLITALHPAVMHNLGKIEILKKAFWQCEIEQIAGGYFEFGVFQGTSLLAAVKTFRKLKSQILRRFYGFDVFDAGFKYSDERDRHPFFQEGGFSADYERVLRRFRKYKEVKLIKGYFEEMVRQPEMQAIQKKEKCAIVFIDCDLMHPASIALEFMKSMFQPGSMIIIDDFWAYKGDSTLGTCGALNKFLKNNPKIRLREFHRYGYNGTSFIVERTE